MQKMAFLEEVADYLLKNHPGRLGEVTVIFPNRRAGLFLKKYLSGKVNKPVWSPNTISLEDFLFSFSDINKSDPLTLIFELYEAFRQHQGRDEGFESFYFWGEMLLRDFEEVDHYLVNPEQLFTYVKDDRQLAEDFYFLTPEQEAIIKKFWEEFLPVEGRQKQQFVDTWRILYPVYQTFKNRISDQKIGYTAHVYRSLLENPSLLDEKNEHPFLIFAGFNAMTLAEEKLIKHFVEKRNAKMIWDIDDYYLANKKQEAGSFLRSYARDPILGKDFPDPIPSRISKPKDISVTGVSLEIGQTKLLGQEVELLLQKGVSKEDIVVILPQDYMLFPVLNALPESVDRLNVTMGYPLKDTPLFGLLETAIELQEQSRISKENEISFYHKPVVDILNHPYLYREGSEDLNELVTDIQNQNKIRIFKQDISALQSTLLNTIFRRLGADEQMTAYLDEIVTVLGRQVVERFGLEREYLYQFHQLLSRLGEILAKQSGTLDHKTFKALFRKAARSVKIPFAGEPVEGLQVMGVLETRNLDFKYVLMLNMNEDVFPSSPRVGSFIPYRIRKGFDMPTFETQDAIFAYLFYRLFQHADQLSFFYNMHAEFGLSGEVSRFIRQIELESGHKVTRKKLSNSLQVQEVLPISIETTDEVLTRLRRYTDQVGDEEKPGSFSASALNIYLECRLKFYFRYVLQLYSGNDLSEDLNARLFGNVLHKTLEFLYQDRMKQKSSRWIEEADLAVMQQGVNEVMEKAFMDEFGMTGRQRFEYEGRNVVMAEVIRKFILQMLRKDRQHVPFEVVSLESEDKYRNYLKVSAGDKMLDVRLGAEIDRVDRKDNMVRVIDYKTGRDETEIGSFDKLFVRDLKDKQKHGRKAGFQTFFYAWLYAAKHGQTEQIVPGLVNINQFFQPDFDFRLKTGNRPIEDARPYLQAFEERLASLIEEIFDKNQSFDQTIDEDKCRYCEFKGICGR